jgi:hypothetical protein
VCAGALVAATVSARPWATLGTTLAALIALLLLERTSTAQHSESFRVTPTRP